MRIFGRLPALAVAAGLVFLAFHQAAGTRACEGLFMRGQRLQACRANAVREAMSLSWRGYMDHAWGADLLRPKTKTPETLELAGMGNNALSMIDALSTLKLMGFEHEFQKASKYIVEHLNYEIKTEINFFETVIRELGGLISAYDLSGSPSLKTKAVELADMLLPAFDGAPTGLIRNLMPLPGDVGDPGSGQVILAEMGTNVLEFGSIARLTGNVTYLTQAERGLRAVHSANSHALLLQFVDRETAKEQGTILSIGGGSDSYYEYLLKHWIMRGKQDDHFRQRWEQAVDEILGKLLMYPPNRPYSYAGIIQDGKKVTWMDHLRCFFPGNVALGVMSGAMAGAKAQRYLQFASNMTLACFDMYSSTPTGLGLEIIDFNQATGESIPTNPSYIQRPEVIEAIFYMWRATKDPKWRDMGWQMWTSIEKHCKWEAGYSGVVNVEEVPPRSDDKMHSWFLAETLKYFWMLFMPDEVLPLDQWVLNTEAHPLRVQQTPQ